MPATCRVYVLQNRSSKFYIGLSDDVARRIEQHNVGVSRWTLSEARKLELLLKRQKGGDRSYRLTGLPRTGA